MQLTPITVTRKSLTRGRRAPAKISQCPTIAYSAARRAAGNRCITDQETRGCCSMATASATKKLQTKHRRPLRRRVQLRRRFSPAPAALHCSPGRRSSAICVGGEQRCVLHRITGGERRSIATPSTASGASVQLRVLHRITGGERRSTALRPLCCLATSAASSPTSHACCVAAPAPTSFALQRRQHRRVVGSQHDEGCVTASRRRRVGLEEQQVKIGKQAMAVGTWTGGHGKGDRARWILTGSCSS